MRIENLRGPHETVGGIVYFGRMLDKIRLHASGKLPADYRENLGGGFDGRLAVFLGLEYPAVAGRATQGGSDEEILEWCFNRGKRPSAEEIEIWNDFMMKRGWRDAASERLDVRKTAAGIAHRDDVQTFFDLLDLDEGRPLRHGN